MTTELIQWLLNSTEPWTRYRTLLDLLDCPSTDQEARAARAAMVAHPQVQSLLAEAGTWGERPITRHNDASHPLYKLSTLADFGLQARERGLAAVIKAVMSHQSPEGAFQSLANVPKAFGGTGQDAWSWMLCDAPTVLYVLLAMGRGQERRVQKAVQHLVNLVDDNGWHCITAPELKVRGPGRKADPCPIANVYALKAIAQIPELADSPAAHIGAEMLLQHWEQRAKVKMYLFGMGTDFGKLKYPFVWYDILHVVDVLSRFFFVHSDARFQALVSAITRQADAQGRYTATSMYQAWKGWSFADKKNPSPWLTFLVLRILKRIA
jgi:hypothetical protein